MPSQIIIVQSGAEVFAFDTIRWPEDAFQYPIVYTASAMTADSVDATKMGWKWIKREQFEWLVKHCDCMVSYTGVVQVMSFYCHNHECWEKNGKDWSIYTMEETTTATYIVPDFDEERKI